MCSSPKSSMSGRPRTTAVHLFTEGLSSQQRKQFAEVANRADERREQRRIAQRRWQQKQGLVNQAPQPRTFWQVICNYVSDKATN